ncbi:MAG TPA: GGDEF domain-containing protein [Polyangiaceae bacterium]|nr:GGDEF domain-containing protein [Polyangiaceae bacterium]
MSDDRQPAARPSLLGLVENQEENLRASSVRVLLGIFSLAAQPVFFPAASEFVWVLVLYALGAILFHLAIRRGIGGTARIVAGGVMDVAFITFLVHRMGSQSTALVAAYVLPGMFNALVVAPVWAPRCIGGLAIVGYAAVCFAEANGYLAYGPDLEMRIAEPTVLGAVRATLYLSAFIAASTWVSERIAKLVRDREIALRKANAQLEQLSQRDPLTQLYNRRFFVQRVQEELERVRRGHPMALLMMDLDGFKHINDKQGHLAGDELLRRIAAAIGETTRVIDVIGRFGGDEFVVLLPDTDAEQATIVAERLVQTVRSVGTEADPKRPVTASVGLSFARAEDDVTILLNTADDAAYRAKEAGGDRFLVATVPDRESFSSGPRASVRAG